LQLAQMETLESATKRNSTCLRDWLSNERRRSPREKNGDPVFAWKSEELTWAEMDKLEDLIVIQAPRSERDVFEQRVSRGMVSVYDFFKSWRRPKDEDENDNEIASTDSSQPEESEKTTHKKKEKEAPSHLRIYHNTRFLAMITSFLAALVAAIIPVVSILVLYFLKKTLRRIYALMGLTIVFAIAFKALTSAKTTDVFAVTAAFVAVEVVFVGSPGG